MFVIITYRTKYLQQYTSHFNAEYQKLDGRSFEIIKTRGSNHVQCWSCLRQYLCSPPRILVFDKNASEKEQRTNSLPLCRSHSEGSNGTYHIEREEMERIGNESCTLMGISNSNRNDKQHSRKRHYNNPSWEKEILAIIEEHHLCSFSELFPYLIEKDLTFVLENSYRKSKVDILFNTAKINIRNQSWLAIVDYVKDTPYHLSIEESITWFKRILNFNNIDILYFLRTCCTILDKLEPKLNGICLKGPTNAGKTLIMECLAQSCIYYTNIPNFDRMNKFCLQDSEFARVILLNEPKIDEGMFELFKNISEGCTVSIEKKYSHNTVLTRTPILIATNQALAFYTHQQQFNESTLRSRIRYFQLSTFNDLKDCPRKLNPCMWKHLLIEYGIKI